MNTQPFSNPLRRISIILLVAGLVIAVPLLFFGSGQKASAGSLADEFSPGVWQSGESLINETTYHANAHCADDPDTFYILGGRDADSTSIGPLHDFMQFNADTGTWIELPHLPEGLLFSTALCYERHIYVVGGEFLGAHNDFYIYDIAAKQWRMGPAAPRFVEGAAIGARDGKLYVAFGTSGTSTYPVDQVDVYDILSETWQTSTITQAEEGQPMPVPVSFPGFAQDGRYLYVVGGFTGDYNANSNVTRRLDMSTMKWELGPIFNSARAMVAVELTDGHLYAIGGDANGGGSQDATNRVEVLDLSSWPLGNWFTVDAPLAEPTQGQSTACTDAFIDGTIWSTGGSNFDGDGDPDIFNANLFYPVEPCINFYAGNLPIEQYSQEASRGTVVRYVIPVVNDGTQVDYYDITVASQWPVFSAVNRVGPIAPGMTGNFLVSILVPTWPVPSNQDTATVTITSVGDTGETDQAFVTTYMNPVDVRTFNLQPVTSDNLSGHPGERVTFKLQVTNMGTVADNYQIDISSSWDTITPMDSISLQPGEGFELPVFVAIPADAKHGDWNYGLVILSSQSDIRVSHTVELTSTAFWHRIHLPQALKN